MIRIEDITVRAGDFALDQVSFEVATGCYAALMGRTGCGKSTLLEAIAGLRSVESGSIQIGSRNVTHEPPAIRGIGYLPQDGALFSTMTVRQHLSFALEVRRWSKERIEVRVRELARRLELEPLLDRFPRGLSGGESQRVALGRAISFEPEALLLDEPLSAVDEETREGMYQLLRRVQADTGATVLHVTHNSVEAQELAEKVFQFREGRIIEDAP